MMLTAQIQGCINTIIWTVIIVPAYAWEENLKFLQTGNGGNSMK